MSPVRRYARPMIDLGTVAGLLEHDHQLHVYCLACDRWAEVDLARLVDAGQGARRLPLAARCRDCGGAGTLQIRPPMPRWSNTRGWMEHQKGA